MRNPNSLGSGETPAPSDFLDFLCKTHGIERELALELLGEFVKTYLSGPRPIAPPAQKVSDPKARVDVMDSISQFDGENSSTREDGGGS